MDHTRDLVKDSFLFDISIVSVHDSYMFTPTKPPTKRGARLRGYSLNRTGTAVVNLLDFGWSTVERLTAPTLALIPAGLRATILAHMGGA